MKLAPTASQTVGPFFRIGFEHLCENPLSREDKTVHVQGRVLDANCEPVPDAVLELWQADAMGHYSDESESTDSRGRAAGFARIATDDKGRFSFTTCRPGAVPFDSIRMQAPHIEVLVFARGLLRHLITRMYFPCETENATDPVLQALPEDRRTTMIARRMSQDTEALEWNIVLQGEDETVFFAW
jgi:protocatechuate 3,4-dioxygenase alpha subunit